MTGLLHSHNVFKVHAVACVRIVCLFTWGCITPHCTPVPHLVYPFICWWTRELLPPFGYCESCCCEHRCINCDSLLTKKIAAEAMGCQFQCKITKDPASVFLNRLAHSNAAAAMMWAVPRTGLRGRELQPSAREEPRPPLTTSVGPKLASPLVQPWTLCGPGDNRDGSLL